MEINGAGKPPITASSPSVLLNAMTSASVGIWTIGGRSAGLVPASSSSRSSAPSRSRSMPSRVPVPGATSVKVTSPPAPLCEIKSSGGMASVRRSDWNTFRVASNTQPRTRPFRDPLAMSSTRPVGERARLSIASNNAGRVGGTSVSCRPTPATGVLSGVASGVVVSEPAAENRNAVRSATS